MKAAQPTRVRFGAFELDLQTGELLAPDRKFVLQEQPFRVLLMLVRRAGQIATREEIQKDLWPNDTVVEFDHAINTVIGNLRRTLGDAVATPKYIQTVARRGYRFVMPIERIEVINERGIGRVVCPPAQLAENQCPLRFRCLVRESPTTGSSGL